MKGLTVIRVSSKDQKYGYGPDSQWEDDVLANTPEFSIEVCEELTRSIQESATGWNREKYEAVIDEAIQLFRQGVIQVVVFPRIDRETRFIFSSAPLLSKMLEMGLYVFFARERLYLDPSDTDAVGRYLDRVSQAQAYVETMRLNTMSGRKRRARSGKLPTGGIGLYGYVYIPGKNEGEGVRRVNEYEAGVVRQMFSWLVDDRISGNEICRRLNSSGIPAPRGGDRWARSTVCRILRNSVYTGETFANRMICVEPKTGSTRPKGYKKVRRELKPRGEWIPLPGVTPEIISRELFGQAQQQLKKNIELSPRNQKHQYLLRALVWCKRCGRRYHGEPEHGCRFYRCAGRSRMVSPEPCRNTRLKADWLEQKVWQEVKAALLKPALIVTELQRKRELKMEAAHLEEALGGKRLEFKRIDAAEDKALDVYLYSSETKEKFLEKFNRFEAQKEDVKKDITELERHIGEARQAEIDEVNIERVLTLVRQNLRGFDFESKRLALEALQIRVKVDGNKISLEGLLPVLEGELLTQQSSLLGRNNTKAIPFELALLKYP